MAELKILIFPYFEELITSIKAKECEKLMKIINKCKPGWEIDLNDIPELGYLGMELDLGNSEKIYINDEKIFFTEFNTTQLLIDPEKKVNDMALNIAVRKYFSELNYFFEVQRYDKLNGNKKRRKNKHIEEAIVNA